MNVLVADQAAQSQKIERLIGALQQVSETEKQARREHEKPVDRLLDAILEKKAFLMREAQEIEAAIRLGEELTWFTNITEKHLESLREIIAKIRVLVPLMLREYAHISTLFQQWQVSKDELKAYRAAIEDLRELADDLEDVFFRLPNDAAIQAATQELLDLE